MRGGRRDWVPAGEHQADRHGDETVLHGRAPARAAKALPDPRNGEGEHARGRADGRSRHHRTGQARDFPADRLTTRIFGPGAAWASANRSANCAPLIHPCTSTTPRCISGSTVIAPPTAISERAE